jgi:hypothetical protein
MSAGAKWDAAVSVDVSVRINGCGCGESAAGPRTPGLSSELAAVLLDWIEAGGRVIVVLVAELVILFGRCLVGSITGVFRGLFWLLKQLLCLLRLGGALALWALARAGDGLRWLEQSLGGGPWRLAPVLLPPWMRTARRSAVEARAVLDGQRVPALPAQLRARHDVPFSRRRELRLPEGS